MGLFDSIAGQVLGQLTGAAGGAGAAAGAGALPGGLLEAVASLLNNPQTGGLSGLVQAFEQQGLGHVIASWIGTGQNLPITAEQLQAVLGNTQVQAIAQKLGLSPQDILGHLSQLLPQVVDHVTPQGAVPQGDGLQAALGMLGGLFSK